MSHKPSTQALQNELKNLTEALETLAHKAEGQTQKELTQLKHQAEKALSFSTHELEKAAEFIKEEGKEVIENTDHYVRKNPWTSVGIGVAVGTIVGLLIGRR